VTASYDYLVIGAGMSGLAAATRLAMFGKRVAVLEAHSIAGGLNSYYRRGKRELDVGLHALTNFAPKAVKSGPLGKLTKQLRIPWEQLELVPQRHSLISFASERLRFSNDFELLRSEVERAFPGQIDGFNRLALYIGQFNEVDLSAKFTPAKEVLATFISENLLIEMLIAPLLIYGSAWENDMDFSQFAIMWKSLYLEGFSRPRGGVRRLIELLMQKAEAAGVEIMMRTKVSRILTGDGKFVGVETEKGQTLMASGLFSSAGLPETMKMLGDEDPNSPRVGTLSFTESIFFMDKKPREFDEGATIIFHNSGDRYHYQRPDSLIDTRSAVICLPNNYAEDDLNEGVYRVTHIANFKHWAELPRDRYLEEKNRVGEEALALLTKTLPGFNAITNYRDVFSPTTIHRYTGHEGGCVYGSPDKSRDGTTKIKNLWVTGTDQGFLGIVGSILSGISMANLHGLQAEGH
jgi:phytoene dehydrogenase-like protein